MPFRAQLEECTCLTPIPSSTQGIRSELNSRNPAILPLKHHQKPCRTPYKVQQLGIIAAKSPSGGHVPLGAKASRLPDGGHVPLGAKRLKAHKVYNHRLAGQSTPPSGRCSKNRCSCRRRLAEPILPSGATQSRTPLDPCHRLAIPISQPGAMTMLRVTSFCSSLASLPTSAPLGYISNIL